MRSPSVFVFCALFATAFSFSQPPAARASDQFPYTAYVSSDDVYIRSGPGKNYYPTDKLPKGTPVEVYRHDPGGWYAIRPYKESFSWVPADAIKPAGDHLGAVTRDHVICYVGTRFSNAHDVQQVRLDKGEEVEILDVKQLGEGDAAQSWCQISPPSGEFRWVFGKFVDRDPPSGVSQPRDYEHLPRQRDAFRDGDDANASSDHAANSGSWVAKGGGSSASAEIASNTSRAADWRSNADRRSDSGSDKPGAHPSDPFQAELDAIDLEVSKIASDEPRTWEFTAARRRAEAELDRRKRRSSAAECGSFSTASPGSKM